MKKFTKYSSFSFYNYCTIYTVRGTQKTTKKSYRYVQFSGFHGNNSNPNLPPFSTVSCVNNYQTFLKKLVKINFFSRELYQYVTCVLPKPTRKLIKNSGQQVQIRPQQQGSSFVTPSKRAFSKRILFKIKIKKGNNHNLIGIYFCDDNNVLPLQNGSQQLDRLLSNHTRNDKFHGNFAKFQIKMERIQT